MGPRTMPDREPRARVFHALGDPTRLAVVDLLAVQDLSPDALAADVGVPGNLLAHHLKVLEAAGVVTRRHSQHDRRRTYVHLEPVSWSDLLPAPVAITAPRVVFVCTHNSARSVLADALWREVSEVPSTSAGTRPAARVNPRTRVAARRAGLTLTTRGPQSVDDVLRADDVVISVCDAVNEELPDLPNVRLHWSVPDPAAADTAVAFGATVEELRARVVRTAPLVRLEQGAARHRRA